MKKNYIVFHGYDTNSAGVWYFSAEKGEFHTGKPCKGFGAVRYAEGSVYTGELYYDGKDFHKIGLGQQDFTHSTIGKTDERIHEKKYKFVGRYDYRKTDWIYGNGVLYYTDVNGKPSHFRKGFFKGLEKIKEYQGEFDYGTLLDGYAKDMEFDYDETAAYRQSVLTGAIAACKDCKTIDALFIGDSYFGLSDDPEYSGKHTFSATFPKSYVNCGINGSKFCDWHNYILRLADVPQPKQIFINLGFNDLHGGKSVKQTFSDYRKLLTQLRNYFPQAKICLLQVVHAPNFPVYYDRENELNALTENTAKKWNVETIDWNGGIAASGENCFHADGIHPNECGYGILFGILNRFLI